MTWLDFGDQRSRVNITAGLSIWWQRHLHRCLGIEAHFIIVSVIDFIDSTDFSDSGHGNPSQY